MEDLIIYDFLRLREFLESPTSSTSSYKQECERVWVESQNTNLSKRPTSLDTLKRLDFELRDKWYFCSRNLHSLASLIRVLAKETRSWCSKVQRSHTYSAANSSQTPGLLLVKRVFTTWCMGRQKCRGWQVSQAGDVHAGIDMLDGFDLIFA